MKLNVKFLALVVAVSLLIWGCGPIRFIEPTKIYYVPHQLPTPIFQEKNNTVVLNKSFGNISESDKYDIYQFEFQRKINKQHDLIFSFVSARRETPYSPYYKPGSSDLAFMVNLASHISPLWQRRNVKEMILIVLHICR